MTRYITFILIAMLMLGTASCNTASRPRRDIIVKNDSSHHLDWMTVKWGARSLSSGVMPPGKFAMYLDGGLPQNITENSAVIEFINEDTPGLNWESGSNEEVRARRANSWTRLNVDVSKLNNLDSKPYSITFRVTSATNAEVVVEEIKD